MAPLDFAVHVHDARVEGQPNTGRAYVDSEDQEREMGVKFERICGKITLMATLPGNKLGLYVSYSERKNGAFDEAVEISKKFGCLTWLDASPIRPDRLHYPTKIVIRLTGQERYFRGILLATASADALKPDFVTGERNHRPAAWRHRNPNPQPKIDFKSVLFMSCLQEVPRPLELRNLTPPQHPTYISF